MFNEENAVEAYVRDRLCGQQAVPKLSLIEMPEPYITAGRSGRGSGWHLTPAVALPRQANDVFVEQHVRDALIRLNPNIEADPNRADEVIHKLRAIVLAVCREGSRATSPARPTANCALLTSAGPCRGRDARRGRWLCRI